MDPVAFETCSHIDSHSLPACPPDILESQSGGNVHYLLESGAVVDDDAF